MRFKLIDSIQKIWINSFYLQGTISLSTLLLIWEFVSRIGIVPISLFPPPSRVVFALIELLNSGELFRDISVSLWRAILGFIIGSLFGIIVGLSTGRNKVIDNYLSPIIQIFRPLPPVAIIPLVIVWFGIGEVSKLFSISFAVFFPIWINAHVGAREVPDTFLWSAKTLNSKGLHLFQRVILPSALPFILTGLRNGVSIAFVMVFVSELAGASSGIGYQIAISQLAYRMDKMIAALLCLGMLGSISDFIITWIAFKLFPWLKFQYQR